MMPSSTSQGASHEAALLSRNRQPGSETREIADGLNVDIDARGEVVGFDIDRASHHLDLETLETAGLPLRTTRVA